MSNRLLFRVPARSRPRSLFPSSRPSFWAAVRSAWRRHRSRRKIVHLDQHLLKDIGLSLAEAEAEANKPFWRA
jgi:uncharacterized protein YjiS (DUF1127 family)